MKNKRKLSREECFCWLQLQGLLAAFTQSGASEFLLWVEMYVLFIILMGRNLCYRFYVTSFCQKGEKYVIKYMNHL